MTKSTILITGASGKTGSAAALELLSLGFPVRALVHREDARSRVLSDAGAEIVTGKLEDLASLSRAMTGVRRAYFVCPWTENQLDISLNFAVAAADHELEHVVALGQWLSSPEHRSIATRRTYLMDRVLEWIPGSTWTLINVGFFADNYMAVLEPIAQLGVMPLPLGSGLNAPVSNEDIGRTVAGALAAPELHAGRTYRPTGPALLSPDQIADSFGRVLGRGVRHRDISPRLFLKAARSMVVPTGLIAQLDHYFQEYRLGAFGVGAPNDAVRFVTGREPEDFDTIAERYIDTALITGLVPAAARRARTRPTVSNKARALAGMARLLLTPAPRLERYELDRAYPEIGSPAYAMSSPGWLGSHDKPGAFGSEPVRNGDH
ncbi:MAG: NmrA family NAD(P)-binding protein [Planctomycetota bacterium]